MNRHSLDKTASIKLFNGRESTRPRPPVILPCIPSILSSPLPFLQPLIHPFLCWSLLYLFPVSLNPCLIRPVIPSFPCSVANPFLSSLCPTSLLSDPPFVSHIPNLLRLFFLDPTVSYWIPLFLPWSFLSFHSFILVPQLIPYFLPSLTIQTHFTHSPPRPFYLNPTFPCFTTFLLFPFLPQSLLHLLHIT